MPLSQTDDHESVMCYAEGPGHLFYAEADCHYWAVAVWQQTEEWKELLLEATVSGYQELLMAQLYEEWKELLLKARVSGFLLPAERPIYRQSQEGANPPAIDVNLLLI